VAAIVNFGATAWAGEPGDAILELHAIGSAKNKLVLAVTKNGITFLDPKTGQSFRAFRSARSAMAGGEPDWVVVRDVDNNGSADVVGAGKPAFVVSGEGEPIYSITAGCGQFHLGDIAGDKAQDLLCRNGAAISVVNYDGQKLWDYKIQGATLGVCRFGDVNGDLKDDVECEIKGKGKFLRISGSGEELGREFDAAQLEAPEDDTPGYAAEAANLLSGETTFDLNGDGTADEWIKQDGTALVIGSKGNAARERVETGTLYSALAEDLDGDGKVEVFVGGAGKVFVIGNDGKLKATTVADPNKLNRQPDVQVERLNANSLEDSAEPSVRAVVEKGKEKLAACYVGNVKKNPFTKVGRTIWALSVDNAGKVKGIERLHSDLEDKTVEGCLTGALKGLTFSKATDPSATVTVTLKFGFLDR
jgi:hypothetical protein